MSADIRGFEDHDRAASESLMDEFQDELVAMDPHHREIRGPGFGRHFVQRMLDDAAENEGQVLIAEDDDRILAFAAGAVRTRDQTEALSIICFEERDVDLFKPI